MYIISVKRVCVVYRSRMSKRAVSIEDLFWVEAETDEEAVALAVEELRETDIEDLSMLVVDEVE
jgi:maleate cis-trans isomerase